MPAREHTFHAVALDVARDRRLVLLEGAIVVLIVVEIVLGILRAN